VLPSSDPLRTIQKRLDVIVVRRKKIARPSFERFERKKSRRRPVGGFIGTTEIESARHVKYSTVSVSYANSQPEDRTAAWDVLASISPKNHFAYRRYRHCSENTRRRMLLGTGPNVMQVRRQRRVTPKRCRWMVQARGHRPHTPTGSTHHRQTLSRFSKIVARWCRT